MKKTILTAIAALAFASISFAADAKAGGEAFQKACKGCHGADGAGNPAVAKMLSATIPALGSADVQKLSDADLAKVIDEGKGKMKPMKGQPSADIVAYIRTLKK
jgi:mono/diheme cytochrome c family protein